MTLTKQIAKSVKDRKKRLKKRNQTKKFDEYPAICTLDFGMNQLTKRISSGLDDDVIAVDTVLVEVPPDFWRK